MGIRIWIWIFCFLPGLFGFVPGLVDLWPRIWRDLLQGKRSWRRRRRGEGRSLNKTNKTKVVPKTAKTTALAVKKSSALKELLLTRMADFSTVVTNQPKFFCETHPTRQKLFYISSYVKLVKIILTSLNQDPNMDFVPYAISLLPIPTSSIISVVQLIQAKKKSWNYNWGKHGNI